MGFARSGHPRSRRPARQAAASTRARASSIVSSMRRAPRLALGLRQSVDRALDELAADRHADRAELARGLRGGPDDARVAALAAPLLAGGTRAAAASRAAAGAGRAAPGGGARESAPASARPSRPACAWPPAAWPRRASSRRPCGPPASLARRRRALGRGLRRRGLARVGRGRLLRLLLAGGRARRPALAASLRTGARQAREDSAVALLVVAHGAHHSNTGGPGRTVAKVAPISTDRPYV